MYFRKKPSIVAYNLETEYLKNPLGIDAENPRFTWQLKDADPSATQKSFHIYVGADSTKIADGIGDLWDWERQSDSIRVTYNGKKLLPLTKYYWGVEVTSRKGAKGEIAISSFETRMMDTENWQGSWITDAEDIDLKPAPYFRKEIQPKKEVRKARAYIVAAGLYEVLP